jgi:hypothetical protein
MQHKTLLALVALLTTEVLVVGSPSVLAQSCAAQHVEGGTVCASPDVPCSPVNFGTGSKGQCTNGVKYVGVKNAGYPVLVCLCEGKLPPYYTFSTLMLSSSVVVPYPAPGTSVNSTIMISSINGYAGTVFPSCTVSGPINLTCVVSPPQVVVSSGGTPAWSLSVPVPTSTPNGSYTVTVNGSDLNHRGPYGGPQSATFTVSHNLTVGGGGSVAITVFLGLLAVWAIARKWRLVKSS